MPETNLNWILLIHQIPPQPGYLRVKIRRRLDRVGAVPLKQSVYLLPAGPQATEDFAWIAKEIRAGGGEAFLIQARFIDGISDPELVALFIEARNREYEQIVNDAQDLAPTEEVPTGEDNAEEILGLRHRKWLRLQNRLQNAMALDFFGAPLKAEAERAATRPPIRTIPEDRPGSVNLSDLKGKTWVTRKGVFVDRIGSAWLIRRFIDPEARFLFVDPKEYEPRPDHLRFDMFEAEFTHEGDQSTFEVLVRRTGIDDPALTAVAQVVHDIDLKENRYNRPETQGFQAMLKGLVRAQTDDDERIRWGHHLFESLYQSFGSQSTK
jgi:hypothetical protein